jgi:predicted nucleic acid-binding protein
LVPLCVRQKATPAAIALFKTCEIVVWWTTPVEIASALARLTRMRQLHQNEWAKARKLAASLGQSWSIVLPTQAVHVLAMQTVERYDLRAADALQLAAALVWGEKVPQGRLFLTADRKLCAAALLVGFDAKQI